MEFTENIKLTKPNKEDYFSLESHWIADNDKIDSAIKSLDDKIETKTYDEATALKSGLLSKDDKAKLDGIDSGANRTIVDMELSSTSTNPVQNKTINAKLDTKLDTATFNTHIDDFKATAAVAGHVIVDAVLQSGSTNPLQNTVINEELNKREPAFTKNTAFNKPFGNNLTDVKVNGAKSYGTKDEVARIDHVHPTDSSKSDVGHKHNYTDINNAPWKID